MKLITKINDKTKYKLGIKLNEKAAVAKAWKLLKWELFHVNLATPFENE